LLAANSANYAKTLKLSSAEVLAAALVAMGFTESAARFLGLFRRGEGFLTFNDQLLHSYSLAGTARAMTEAQAEFF
jgi:ribosome biogenesis protein Tsr3